MRFPLTLLLMLFVITMASSPALAQAPTQTSAQTHTLPAPDLKPENFQVGQQYFKLPSPGVLYDQDDGQVEVLSFFWYNCGSCYYVDLAINAWEEKLPPNVRLVRLPFFSRGPTIFHARLVFALENLGLGPDIHTKVFELFQKQNRPIFRAEELPQLAKELNINEKELIAAYNSAEVEAKMDQLGKVLSVYNLDGVPAMVVDGKYRFDTGTTRGAKNFFELTDILIERQQEVRAKK